MNGLTLNNTIMNSIQGSINATNDTNLLINHNNNPLYYICAIILACYNMYSIICCCAIVHILLTYGCAKKARRKIPYILACIYYILYKYDNVQLLKSNAHTRGNMSRIIHSPWNTNIYKNDFTKISTTLNNYYPNKKYVIHPHTSHSGSESQRNIHSVYNF